MAPKMNRKIKGVTKKKSGFVYKPRSTDQVKKRAERTGGGFDSIFKQGFDTWRPKAGDNLIRYMPPTWDDHEHYGYTIFVHPRIGVEESTYLCPQKMLNKPCPVCEAAKEAKDAGDADEAKSLMPKEQIVAWIVDRDDDDLKPVLFQQSWTFDRDISALCIDKRKGKILLIDHPEEGYDISFQRSGQGLNTRYFGQTVDREPSPISDDDGKQQEILDFIEENPIPDVLNFFSYDKLEAVISGKTEKKDDDLDDDDDDEDEDKPKKKKRPAADDDDDDEEEEAPRRKKKPAADDDDEEEEEAPRRKKKVVEEDEDEDEEETPRRKKRPVADDDEDEEEAPKRSRGPRRDEEEDEDEEEAPKRKKRPSADDDDDDEDEDEDEPAPKKKKKVVVEDEDEDEEEEPRRRRR